MKNNLNSRFEIKFKINGYTRKQLEIYFKSICFKEKYPERKIHNLYFDTKSFDFYNQNEFGLGEKIKVRIRWYDEFRNKPQLEIKKNLNGIIIKDIVKVNVINWNSSNLSSFIQKLKNEAALSEMANVLSPVVFNNYSRSYFENPLGNVRATIDEALEFEHFHLKDKIKSNFIVVEVKSDCRNKKDLMSVLNKIPFRRTKFSKYVVGLDSVLY